MSQGENAAASADHPRDPEREAGDSETSLSIGLTDSGEDTLWFDTAAKRQAIGWVSRGDFVVWQM